MCAISLFPMASRAVDAEALRHVQESVTLMCRGGTISGNSTAYEVEGGVGGNSVIFKGLLGFSGNAKARFTHKEWEGVEATLQKGYVECVQFMMPMFMKKLGAE